MRYWLWLHDEFVDRDFEILSHQQFDHWDMIICNVLNDLIFNFLLTDVGFDKVLMRHDVMRLYDGGYKELIDSHSLLERAVANFSPYCHNSVF